jgi:hypothetical protein
LDYHLTVNGFNKTCERRRETAVGLKEIALYWGLYAFVCVCLRERERGKVCVRERHGIY